jgi:hypothetical protein
MASNNLNNLSFFHYNTSHVAKWVNKIHKSSSQISNFHHLSSLKATFFNCLPLIRHKNETQKSTSFITIIIIITNIHNSAYIQFTFHLRAAHDGNERSEKSESEIFIIASYCLQRSVMSRLQNLLYFLASLLFAHTHYFIFGLAFNIIQLRTQSMSLLSF